MFQNGALAQLVPPVELGVGDTGGEAEGELDCEAVGVDVGQVPPPRLFAAGAIVGAEQNAQIGSVDGGSATIYLAEGAIPAASAPPAAPVARRGPCVPGVSPCNQQLRFRR